MRCVSFVSSVNMTSFQSDSILLDLFDHFVNPDSGFISFDHFFFCLLLRFALKHQIMRETIFVFSEMFFQFHFVWRDSNSLTSSFLPTFVSSESGNLSPLSTTSSPGNSFGNSSGNNYSGNNNNPGNSGSVVEELNKDESSSEGSLNSPKIEKVISLKYARFFGYILQIHYGAITRIFMKLNLLDNDYLKRDDFFLAFEVLMEFHPNDVFVPFSVQRKKRSCSLM